MSSTRNNPLIRLRELGQSVWLDDLSRPLIESHLLADRIREDGLSGVTTNPAIFLAALSATNAYEPELATLARQDLSAKEIYDELMISDVVQAADLFRPTYDETGGRDGFVSIEVSPRLARDTLGTIDEARRIWKSLGRDNVLIKIPATIEGLGAIERCMEDGINVNITLLFSVEMYSHVMAAHLHGLEARAARGQAIDRLSSVASFFLSRIDTKVDAHIDALRRNDPSIEKLRGQAGIAWAKNAYRVHERFVATPRWRALAERGARRQRLLWASTSTKDPSYSDVKYVEPLIAPETVTTMPVTTLDAFRDHGRAEPTLASGEDEARRTLGELWELGINMEEIAEELSEEGIETFRRPYDEALEWIADKRDRHMLPSSMELEASTVGRYGVRDA